MLLDKQINQIIELAIKAGKATLEIYNSGDFEIELKSDNSPLTKADKISNEIIVSGLSVIDPSIPILSEEGKEIPFEERKTWKRFWLIDPLDGTKEFIKKNGEFTINIALIEDRLPIWGVIFVPVTGELYWGGVKTGSWKKDSRGSENIKLHVSSKNKDDYLTVVQSRSNSGKEEEEFYSKFRVKNKISKGSSLKMCMVAEGKADLYFRGGPTWEWDTGAGHAILRGAGGYFVNKDKSGLIYNKEVLKNFGFIVSAFKLGDRI